MPLTICRLLSDPTLLIYSLNWRIQAVQSLLAQTFDHSCCLFLSLLHFFFFFCTWYSSSVWIQLCRTTTQLSRATACLGQEARRKEETIETVGEREGYNSYCNSSCRRSIYSYCNYLILSSAIASILTDNITKYILKLGWTKTIHSLPLLILSKVLYAHIWQIAQPTEVTISLQILFSGSAHAFLLRRNFQKLNGLAIWAQLYLLCL